MFGIMALRRKFRRKGDDEENLSNQGSIDISYHLYFSSTFQDRKVYLIIIILQPKKPP